MTPKQLRNGMVILFLLTAINVYQTWVGLHHLDEAAIRHSHVDADLRKMDAVVNQLCISTHTACLYTLPVETIDTITADH